MDVLFLTHSPDAPSVKWRVHQFLPHLESCGIRATVRAIDGGLLGKLKLIKSAEGYDAVVLQKRLLNTFLLKRLRRMARKLVYEFDDAVMVKRSGDGVVPSRGRRKRFGYIVSHADGVVTTNAYLARMAAEFVEERNIHLVPNGIDAAKWETKGSYDAGSPFVIGWQGTASNLQYLKLIAEPLKQLADEGNNLVLKIVSDGTIDIPGVPLVIHPYSARTEVEDILSFDVGIAPLSDDAWTKGKQSVKILCYFAAGLPVVASAAESHNAYIEHERNGFLAADGRDWHKMIGDLIRSKSLRESVGKRARALAESRFSIASIAEGYAKILRSL